MHCPIGRMRLQTVSRNADLLSLGEERERLEERIDLETNTILCG